MIRGPGFRGHSLRLEYLYGLAETMYTVLEAKQTEDTTKTTTTPASKKISKMGTLPKTGYTASMTLWVIMVLLSGMVITGSVCNQ